MSQKTKFIIGLALLFVIVSGATFYVLWRKDQQTITFQQPSSGATDRYINELKNSGNNTNSIPLNQAPQPNQSQTLGVNNSSNNDLSLGTQQFSEQTNNSSQSTNNSTVPRAESFSEYEAYKDKTEVYYQDTVTGTGSPAQPNKRVAVAYKGWLTNGTLFDYTKTKDNGEIDPFIFTLGAGEVIRGWDIGVENMKVGGTRRIIIPPSLGYGSSGTGGMIPPDAVLIFDIQLLATE